MTASDTQSPMQDGHETTQCFCGVAGHVVVSGLSDRPIAHPCPNNTEQDAQPKEPARITIGQSTGCKDHRVQAARNVQLHPGFSHCRHFRRLNIGRRWAKRFRAVGFFRGVKGRTKRQYGTNAVSITLLTPSSYSASVCQPKTYRR